MCHGMRRCLSWSCHKLPMFHAGVTMVQPHAAPQCPPTTSAPPMSLLHTEPRCMPACPPSPFTHLLPTCPFAHLARTRLTQPSAGASGTDCTDCPVMRLQESSYAMHHKQAMPGHGPKVTLLTSQSKIAYRLHTMLSHSPWAA